MGFLLQLILLSISFPGFVLRKSKRTDGIRKEQQFLKMERITISTGINVEGPGFPTLISSFFHKGNRSYKGNFGSAIAPTIKFQ